jgi:16S rRNA (uracil1498-N3)-methyltransferase
MSLFYSSAFSKNNPVLSPEESHHATRVLRLKAGEKVQVTDGKGSFFQAVIREIHEKKTLLEVIAVEESTKRQDFYIHLAIAPTKNIDRIEWMLEKCVEIGIDEISFLLCQRSERKQLRLDRLEKIAAEAMKQSLKSWFPKINDIQPYESFLKKNIQTEKYVAHLNDNDRKLLSQTASPHSSYCVLIGPEGDFSEKEVKQALEAGFLAVTLGESRLRTETAGLVACHTLQLLNE